MSIPSTELVLAAATGSTGGAGKIGTVAASGSLIVRCPNAAMSYGHADRVLWRCKSDQAYSLDFYRARSIVNAATLTLAAATRVDDTDTFVLNGLTYTAESTAGDAAWASRKWLCGGADESADALQLTALLNADYAVVPDGSVVVGDTLVITTTCDGHGSEPCPTHTYTFTAAATPSYSTSVFDQSGNQAAELASLVLAINHRRNFKLASVAAGTTVSVVGQNGIKYTYSAHATTTTTSARQFAINGTNAQDAAELATCINDATYGVPGYTAVVQNTDEVHIRRNAATVPEPVLSASASTVTCTNTVGGVPGLVAVATGATGELGLTPSWVKSVTATGGTHITATSIDIPGIYASRSSAVITLSCTTPGSPSGGLQSYVIQFAQGTSDANEVAFASTTLASLIKDPNLSVSGAAANSTTAGSHYEHWVDGYDQVYCVYTNGSGSTAANVTIGAVKF